ncbi:MAG: ABC transporter permease [Desulfobacterales bacterium]|jgi:peptide/nickel transport system permease protein|nr:ABC transporter permease [Desulfobacterales bacterium]
MRTYIIKRLLNALLTLFLITLLTFFFLALAKDPARMMAGPEASEEDLMGIRRELGLDRPVHLQYLMWLGRVVQGDFGRSYVGKTAAINMVAERLPATLWLTVTAMGIALVLSIPLGMIAAVRRGSLVDALVSALGVSGQAMPLFWFGIMLIIVFGVNLRLFPVSGYGTPAHLVLPAVTLGVYTMPVIMRLTRSSFLDVLSQDYIRTAKAKGVPRHLVLFKHALRNAALPIVLMVGMQLGVLVGGAVVTETVFSWPGIGRLAVDSVVTGDFPVVQATVMLLAAAIMLMNLVADIVVAFIDPRIHFH